MELEFQNDVKCTPQVQFHLLCCQYFVVHVIQGGAVSHVEGPKQSVSFFLYLLCL